MKMSMKNKGLALLTAAAVGVIGLAPITVKAFQYESTCTVCGQDSFYATVVNSRIVTLDAKPCEHGYKAEADLYLQHEELVSYYCPDCDRHWEYWETASYPYWKCGHDLDER